VRYNFLLGTVRMNKDCTTINEKYPEINRIEQAEDAGLSISYENLMYKTTDSISMLEHIYSIPERES